MDLLTRRIEERLMIRKACRVFGNELDRVWQPTTKEQLARQERIEQIREYAKSHGWSVVIHDSGLQATFRRAE
jgi:hypothetical protein